MEANRNRKRKEKYKKNLYLNGHWSIVYYSKDVAFCIEGKIIELWIYFWIKSKSNYEVNILMMKILQFYWRNIEEYGCSNLNLFGFGDEYSYLEGENW